jgi:hypothetical protein
MSIRVKFDFEVTGDWFAVARLCLSLVSAIGTIQALVKHFI